MTLSKLQLKALITESAKEALSESPAVRKNILESRLRLIESEIGIDEAGWIDRAREWVMNKAAGAEQGAKNLGRSALVNPSAMIDDPAQVQRLMASALNSAKQAVTSFKADGLKTSTTINRLQETILDLFGKFFTLLDQLPASERGKMEREVMKIVAMYYVALMEEKKRIEVYLSHLAREVGSQGYNLGKSADAMAGFKAPAAPKVQGSRVVDPEMSTGLAGARA